VARPFQSVPTSEGSNRPGWVKQAADAINAILNGRRNTASTVTLTANTTTTTITDARLHPDSFIGLTPKTSNAAAAWATTYVSSRTTGSAVLTHANNAQTDRVFICDIGG
jgi:hypothetical protein